MRHRLLALLLGIGLSAAGLVVDSGPATASTHTVHGCPSGATCLYRSEVDFANGVTAYQLFSYGYHDLANMNGQGALVENQTGGANIGTYWCAGYGGTGTLLGAASGPNSADGYSVRDPLYLTPVNSVVLTNHYSAGNPPTNC